MLRLSRPTASGATVLLLCLAAASLHLTSAAHIYAGPQSFIGTFLEQTQPLELDGATLRLLTKNESYGLGLAGMSALHITLEPCTVLQPHIHPHSEFVFTVSGEVTHSVAYNNGTLTDVKENTVKNVGQTGFAVFPAGTLHVTQNEGCSQAVLVSVFNAQPDLYFFPYTEAYLPANTIKSFFGGRVSNNDAWKPVGTAKLSGCECRRRRMM